FPCFRSHAMATSVFYTLSLHDALPISEDSVSLTGNVVLKNAAPERLLLVAEALAVSVALAYDEIRIAEAFDRIEPVANSLVRGKDRKSTRLNSSHVKISYAVFCLKKKK